MWRKGLRNLRHLWQALDQQEKPARIVSLPPGTLDVKAGEMYGLNQWVRVKDYAVCVAAIEDVQVRPFRFSFEAADYEAPDLVLEDGSVVVGGTRSDWPRIVFVNVIYHNPTQNKTLDYRRNQWFLFDSDGYSYEAVDANRFLYENNDKPFLGGTRYLNPGLKARGWLAYELKDQAVPERIQFVDGFLRGNSVDFLLNVPPKLTDSRSS